MNPIQKALYKQQINWNRLKYDKLCKKYDITTIESKDNVFKFIIGGKTFYYDITKGKVKKWRSPWTGKIVTLLKEEFKGKIPLVSEPVQSLDDEDPFGLKEIDKEIEEKENNIKGFNI